MRRRLKKKVSIIRYGMRRPYRFTRRFTPVVSPCSLHHSRTWHSLSTAVGGVRGSAVHVEHVEYQLIAFDFVSAPLPEYALSGEAVEDLEYFQQALYAALQVPAEYMG